MNEKNLIIYTYLIMNKRKGLWTQILVFLIIAFLLFSVIWVMVIYLNPPTPEALTFPTEIEIQDALSGSAIQLSGSNLEWATITELQLDNDSGNIQE